VVRSHAIAAATDGDLPDVNVWLALAVQDHPHHTQALDYWRHEAATRLWFCRVTMLGLVRLLTQPKLMGAGALDPRSALTAYERFAELPEVGLHIEPLACDEELRRILQPGLPRRLLTDAYLAAFALSASLRLVTFDRDFERFEGLNSLQLAPGQASA
jgi:toxin-antitoxin system PIN domain toxin